MSDMFTVAIMALPVALACAGIFMAAYYAPVWVPKVAIRIMGWIAGALEFIGRIWESKARPGRW